MRNVGDCVVKNPVLRNATAPFKNILARPASAQNSSFFASAAGILGSVYVSTIFVLHFHHPLNSVSS